MRDEALRSLRGDSQFPRQISKGVRKGGLEPPRYYPQEPESCASASSATFACCGPLLYFEGSPCQRPRWRILKCSLAAGGTTAEAASTTSRRAWPVSFPPGRRPAAASAL